MKFVLFSDLHEHAVFSARALLDKRLFGLVNSSFCRHGSYRMERIGAAVRIGQGSGEGGERPQCARADCAGARLFSLSWLRS